MKIKTIDLIKMVSRFTIFSVILQTISLSVVFASNSSAQNTSLKDVYIVVESSYGSVNDVFMTIETQTDFRFAYSKHNLTGSKNIEIKAGQRNVYDILAEVSKEMRLKFIRINNSISVEKTKGKSIGIVELKAISITGNVKNSDGEGLPGTAVAVKGTSLGTITDMDGNYTIEVPDENSVLLFSSLGYVTQEITVGTQTTINVTLEISDVALDDVIVTALGIKREKKSLGYTATKVSGEVFALTQAPNVANALSGKAAGVFVTNPSSIEGGSTRITIRGNTSLAGGNQPLIIVDGLPFANDFDHNTTASQKATSNRDYGSALNQIEALDIESMDILKGTAASALYGSRGANGVILITTKKGAGKTGMKVEYTLNTKFTTPYRYQDFQNEYGYGGPGGANGILWQKPVLGTTHPDIWGDGYGVVPSIDPVSGNNHNSWSYDQFSWYGTNSSWGPKLDGTMITWWDGEERPWSPQPDNMSMFYKNGSTVTHNLSLTNNGEFGSFRTSVTLKDNDAVIDNSGFESTNIYIGGNIKLADKLNAEIFTTFNRKTLTNPPLLGQTNNSFTNIFYNLPRSYKGLEWTDYKNPDGSRKNQDGWGYWLSKHNGWDFHENEYKQYLNQMRSYVKLLFNPTDWLSLAGSAGLDFTSKEKEDRYGFTDGIGLVGGRYTHSLARTFAPNLDFLATLHKDNLIDGLNGSLSFGGQSWSTNRYYINGNINTTAKSPYIYSFANYETDPTANKARPAEERYEKKINSLFGFMDISYKDFIYLQVTARNDWSSTLPKENNDYFYPGASLSFIASELIDMGSVISFAKLRVAYAETGSDTDPYEVVPSFEPGSFGGRPTVSMQDGLPNLDLQSQRSKEFEIGTNMTFFNNRLRVDLTYYNKHSFNQILSAPLPWSSGSNSIKFNTGELELKGFEFELSGTVLSNSNLRWDIGIVGSKFSNTLLSLTEGVDIYNIGGLWGAFGTTMRATVGESFGAIYGWGIAKAPNGRPILNALNDINGNVTSTLYRKTDEEVIVGNATPKMIGAFNSTLTWKNFTLFTLIDYKWGGDVYCPQYGNALIGGLSPATLEERNGGGLPYTYPNGGTENIGVIMDGVIETSEGVFVENTNVVHAYYKYAGNGWNPNPQPQAVFENTWVKLRELSLSYRLPESLMSKVKFVQGINVSVIGRDLFYFYDTMPDNINPEGLNGVGDAQYVIAGALPGMRSFAFSLRLTF